jgi:hypothetical protein
MIQPSQNRLLTCLLLAAYVAVSTLSSLFHDHGCDSHGSCAGHGASSLCHHTADHDGDHHADAEHGRSHDEDLATLDHDVLDHDAAEQPLHDDDCTICRFVGQRVMPVAVTSPQRLCDFHVELPALRVSQPLVPLARTLHSRAPPTLSA